MLTLALLSLSLRGMSQAITFDQLTEGKGIVRNSAPLFIGFNGQDLVLIQRQGRLKNRLELVHYTGNLKEQNRTIVSNGGDPTCYGGYLNGNNIDLLQAKHFQDGMHIYRDRRNLQTLQPDSTPQTLFKRTGVQGDQFLFNIAVSPNGKLLACVAVANRMAQGFETTVGLYNHQLEEYWTQTNSRTPPDNIAVTDEGDIILYTLDEQGDCRFTLFDGEQIQDITFKIPKGDPVVQRTLLRYGDGNILLADAVRQENHVLMPVGTNIDCIDIHCYKIQKKTLSTVRRPLTQHEVNRLTNQKEDTRQNRLWVQFGRICQTLQDSSGAYLMLDQQWNLATNGVPTAVQRMGMMVMRIDRNGEIQWSTAKRMTSSASLNKSDYLGYQWLTTPCGIMLAWMDHADNTTYPYAKPVKLFEPTSHPSTLNVWTLTPDGKEDQSFIETGRQALAGAAHSLAAPGEYIVILTTGRKDQLTKISIENL